MEPAEIRLLEDIAEHAWPAETVETVDGWRLRYTWTISRRVDSVSANRCTGAMPLDERIAAVEAFYAARNAPARFHLTPLTEPADLTHELDARGYAPFAATTVQTADSEGILDTIAAPEHFRASIREALTPDWLDVYAQSGGWPAAEVGHREGILRRSAPRQAYAVLSADDTACAVGRGVLEAGWLGIFCMGTAPAFRGRGAGRAVLRALVEWGREQRARQVYLQVMPDNLPAVALYRRAGFVTQYEYYYREKQING